MRPIFVDPSGRQNHPPTVIEIFTQCYPGSRMSTSAAVSRVFNFSAGPAVLPLPVLEQIQDELLRCRALAAAFSEISHRSKDFDAILADALVRSAARQRAGFPRNFVSAGR